MNASELQESPKKDRKSAQARADDTLTKMGIKVLGAKLAEGEWVTVRQEGVGGSVLPTLLGESPYREAREHGALLAYRQIVEGHEIETTNAMEVGKRLEAWCIERLSAHAKIDFAHLGDVCFYRPEEPHERASVDALSKHAVAECKVTSSRWASGWGDSGTSEVPEHVRIQCNWVMHVVDRQICYVVVFFRDTCQFRFFKVLRDEDLIAHMREVAREFWGYVERREPPPPFRWGEPQWTASARKGRTSWKAAFHGVAEAFRGYVKEQEDNAVAIAQNADAAMQPMAKQLLHAARHNVAAAEQQIKAVIQEHTAPTKG